jgi:glutamate 5-kinase
MSAKGSKKKQRWVIKAGSNLIVSGGPILLRSWMQQVAALRRAHGIEVVWVTSGAIASAIARTAFKKNKRELSEKQALSAIGQPLLMDLYNLSLGATGLLGAQVLLTYDDLAHKKRRLNFQNTIEKLLQWKVTPILNENDAVATEEIRFGDNDNLSAQVACTVGADRLVILTDVDGLFDKDPRENRDAKLISHLPKVSPRVLGSVSRSAGSSRGTGGMFSKLSAAQMAARKGIECALVRGDHPNVLVQLASGKRVGTRIGGRK